MQTTQFYTVPFVSLPGARNSKNLTKNTIGAISEGANTSTEPDVVVHEHLEKEGISSEIITAKTTSSLYEYLKSKGLNIENDSIPALQSYLGKDYSFVVSWMSPQIENISFEDIKNNLMTYYVYRSPEFTFLINSLEKKYPEFKKANSPVGYLKSQQGAHVFQELAQAIQNDPSIVVGIPSDFNFGEDLINQKGILVTFPTEKIYFPLLPTSVYGSKIVPATIRVFGHVSPVIFQDIKSYTKTEYLITGPTYFANDLKNFYNKHNKNIEYTKIEINAPSKFFTDDLWMHNYAPKEVQYPVFIANYPIVVTIILFLVSSIIAGILAGMILFRDLRKNLLKLTLIGVSNCLTILSLLVVTIFVGTKNNIENESIHSLLAELKQKGYFWKRKVAVFLSVAMIPSLSFGIFVFPEFIEELSADGIELIIDDFVPTFIIYILPILGLITAYKLIKIKVEDKNLFGQLKEAGYSSWSFHPKDKMKFIFVPIFSVAFLFMSWLLITLIKITI